MINLPQSSGRRRHIESELRHAGLDYEIVPAVDGVRLKDEERARLVDAEAVARSPDWLRPGIIGCSLSHLEVYRRIVASGERFAFVIEDDVSFDPSIRDLLAALEGELRGSEAALLYYRSVRPCQFSGEDAVHLGGESTLMYPMELEPLNATGAYVLTAQAARKLSGFILPVRVGPDSWGVFHEGGALDRLRCVVPRPVRTRTDLKSTVDYLGSHRSLRQRVMTAIADHRVFPAYQLLALRRAAIERRMSRFSVVSDRSPYATEAMP